MSELLKPVNDIAVLSNVGLALDAVQLAYERGANMPGIMCLHGRSGLGKSMAAAYLTIKFDACYIQSRFLWATNAYLRAILDDLGLSHVRGTNAVLLATICSELQETDRLLIIDEADYLVDKGLAPLVMDIFEGSGTPVLIIGEERLPTKLLTKHEKIHRRVLHWIGAQPATLEDCKKMAPMYVPGVTIADDLLEHINNEVGGCTGRVSVNLSAKVRTAARRAKMTEIDREWWGERPLDLGKTENRRGS